MAHSYNIRIDNVDQGRYASLVTGTEAVSQIDRYSREYSISPLKALERLVEDGLLHPIEKLEGSRKVVHTNNLAK